MKHIFKLNQSLMNGTKTMITSSFSFATKELAEKVRDDLKIKNKGQPIVLYIQESILYESEDEVPCLKNET